MKKLLSALAAVGMIAMAAIAGTRTDRMNLYRPTLQETGWGNTVNDNFTVIDSSAALLYSTGTQTFIGPVEFSSSVVISSPTMFQVKIATQTYPGTERLAVNGASKFFGPTGASISMCDSAGQNCTNLTIDNSNPATGLNTSTITTTGLLTVPKVAMSTFTASSGTVTNMRVISLAISTMTASSATVTGLRVSGLTAGQCVQAGTGGELTVSGAGCGSGGGTSNPLAVFEDLTKVSSPTPNIKYDGGPFNVSLLGAGTAYIQLDPSSVTLQGQNVIKAQNSLQSGATAYPDYLYVGSTSTFLGKTEMRSNYDSQYGDQLVISNPNYIGNYHSGIRFDIGPSSVAAISQFSGNYLCSDLTACMQAPMMIRDFRGSAIVGIDTINSRLAVGNSGIGHKNTNLSISGNSWIGSQGVTATSAPTNGLYVEGPILSGTSGHAYGTRLNIVAPTTDIYSLRVSTDATLAHLSVSTMGIVTAMSSMTLSGGRMVRNIAPSDGQVIQWNASNSVWEPTAIDLNRTWLFPQTFRSSSTFFGDETINASITGLQINGYSGVYISTDVYTPQTGVLIENSTTTVVIKNVIDGTQGGLQIAVTGKSGTPEPSMIFSTQNSGNTSNSRFRFLNRQFRVGEDWGDSSQNTVAVWVSSVIYTRDGSTQTVSGQPLSASLATLKTTTPPFAGRLYFCTDCANDAVCSSTGTTQFAISRMNARGISCQ